MIDWSRFTTKFRTYDKLYHAVGCAGAFLALAHIMSPWLAAVCVTLGGFLKELRDQGKTFWDWYDIAANTGGYWWRGRG